MIYYLSTGGNILPLYGAKLSPKLSIDFNTDTDVYPQLNGYLITTNDAQKTLQKLLADSPYLLCYYENDYFNGNNKFPFYVIKLLEQSQSESRFSITLKPYQDKISGYIQFPFFISEENTILYVISVHDNTGDYSTGLFAEGFLLRDVLQTIFNFLHIDIHFNIPEPILNIFQSLYLADYYAFAKQSAGSTLYISLQQIIQFMDLFLGWKLFITTHPVSGVWINIYPKTSLPILPLTIPQAHISYGEAMNPPLSSSFAVSLPNHFRAFNGFRTDFAPPYPNQNGYQSIINPIVWNDYLLRYALQNQDAPKMTMLLQADSSLFSLQHPLTLQLNPYFEDNGYANILKKFAVNGYYRIEPLALDIMHISAQTQPLPSITAWDKSLSLYYPFLRSDNYFFTLNSANPINKWRIGLEGGVVEG